MEVRFLKIAQFELYDAVSYYDIKSHGLGYRFLKEVFAAIDRIKKFPEAWQPFYAETMRCLVRKFPYGVIYIHINKLILIVAIMNLHKKPDYWINRLIENKP